jgi:hypothetical protein
MEWNWKDWWNHFMPAGESYFEGNASQWLVSALVSPQKILSQIFFIIPCVSMSTSTKYVIILACINEIGSTIILRRLEVINL